MISDTRMAYGSLVTRHGRSRCSAAYHVRSWLCTRITKSGAGWEKIGEDSEGLLMRPQALLVLDGTAFLLANPFLAAACLALLASLRSRACKENTVSPPSIQHFASDAGRFSQSTQSLASLSTCPLTHFAYMIWSFTAGSSGLILLAAILGTKNLHHGTVMDLP